MTLTDYMKESHDRWVAKDPIATPIGSLAVQLSTGSKKKPPTDEMLRRADEFIAQARATIEGIHDKVFASYQSFAGDPDWLEQCDVPANLDRAGVLAYLEDSALTVDRNDDPDEPYVCGFYASPAWDEEHGLYLSYVDGNWCSEGDGDDAEPTNPATQSANEQLMNAIIAGDRAGAERLFATGMDLNAFAPGEVPPLWMAVHQWEPAMVRRLLELGADPSLKSPVDKTTALQLAKAKYKELGFAPTKKHPIVVIKSAAAEKVKALLDEIIPLLEAAGGKS